MEKCPTCWQRVVQSGSGRPRVYCSENCRVRAKVARRRQLVELGREAEQAAQAEESESGLGVGVAW